MKTLVLFGSPRKKGNTASLLTPFMDEMKSMGAEVECLDVYEKNIAGCRACMCCQKDQDNINCVLPDDMQPIFQKIQECDLLLIAAPVYNWSVPAPVKAVLDRMVYSCNRYYGENATGKAFLKGKYMACLTTCGYPVEKGADIQDEIMKRCCKYMKMNYAGIYAERHVNLTEAFMTDEKEQNARAFARQVMEKVTGSAG